MDILKLKILEVGMSNCNGIISIPHLGTLWKIHTMSYYKHRSDTKAKHIYIGTCIKHIIQINSTCAYLSEVLKNTMELILIPHYNNLLSLFDRFIVTIRWFSALENLCHKSKPKFPNLLNTIIFNQYTTFYWWIKLEDSPLNSGGKR